ncbi:MAG: circadian clock KaiB family protein [Sediminibacterium sp.]
MAKNNLYGLRWYVVLQALRSVTALKNIARCYKEHLACMYILEVKAVLKNPQLAESARIFAIPTLVRKFLIPIQKVFEDFPHEERVLVGLNIRLVTLKKQLP